MSKAVYTALAKVFAIALIVLGAGAIIGGKFAHGMVSDQLSQQKIDMPSKGGIEALKDEESKEILRPYIGQKLTTGPQAKAFADNYVLQHMEEASGGKTFEEVSSAYMKAQNGGTASEAEVKKLQSLRQTLFEGNSIRGMLLNAYGWWFVGSVAFYAGIGLIVLGVVLGIVGFVVLRPKKEAVAVSADA